jgi:hypothetical protein
MAKKVRYFKSKQYYENVLNDYFEVHKDRVLQNLLEKTGCSDMEQLRRDEFGMRWGLDCGFVTLAPTNPNMQHEWELDNGKYSYKLWLDYPYPSQSVTLKDIQARFLLEDLNLTKDFYIDVRLD